MWSGRVSEMAESEFDGKDDRQFNGGGKSTIEVKQLNGPFCPETPIKATSNK